MKSDIDIVVIHDDVKEHSLLITDLSHEYNTVELISDPEEGLKYVADHLGEKIIVVLDIDFGEGEMNGYEVLEKIRERSYLIEVIILSARDLPDGKMIEHVNQLFGLRAFDYVVRGKNKWQEKLKDSVDRAADKILHSIDSIIESWILENPEDKNKPIFFTGKGKSYTLNEILVEIRQQSEIGKEFAVKLNSLTIDLLLRGKKRL